MTRSALAAMDGPPNFQYQQGVPNVQPQMGLILKILSQLLAAHFLQETDSFKEKY